MWESGRRLSPRSPEVERSPAFDGAGEGDPARPRPLRTVPAANASEKTPFRSLQRRPRPPALLRRGKPLPGRAGSRNRYPNDTIGILPFPAALPLLPSSGDMPPRGEGLTPSDFPLARLDEAPFDRRFADIAIES
ncbi:MAG: hypothetical protein D6812_08500 [Deltaproteobacteria bacterium]|nr:MAG: hypothetical protein D6812_08500 [Deltaproteobacteria bacterium]